MHLNSFQVLFTLRIPKFWNFGRYWIFSFKYLYGHIQVLDILKFFFNNGHKFGYNLNFTTSGYLRAIGRFAVGTGRPGHRAPMISYWGL